MSTLSAKDVTFKLHIEGREAVELEMAEIESFAETYPDKILVDKAFMQMARKVIGLLQQRAEMLEALKKCRFDSLNMSLDTWREIQETIKRIDK